MLPITVAGAVTAARASDARTRAITGPVPSQRRYRVRRHRRGADGTA